MHRKIGVLGMGAIGSLMTSLLYENPKNKLTFYSRTAREAVQIEEGDTVIDIPVRIETTLQNPVVLDWLIVCLKEHQFDGAHKWFSSLISPTTKVLIIRNGIDHMAPLLTYTEANNCVAGLIDCPVQMQDNGYYKVFKKPIITISNARYEDDISAIFNDKSNIHASSDFKSASWIKLCESACLGAVLCLANDTCRILKDPKWLARFTQLLDESIQVAKADGAQLPLQFKQDILNKVAAYPPDKGSSMLSDMRMGNKVELGAKNGVIVKKGMLHNIATPHNDAVVSALSSLRNSNI